MSKAVQKVTKTKEQQKAYESFANSLKKQKEKKNAQDAEKREKVKSIGSYGIKDVTKTDEQKKAYSSFVDSYNRENEKQGRSASRDFLTNYTLLKNRDSSTADNLMTRYQAQKNNKTSKFYDPYAGATHSSVSKLKEMGYDADDINDEWFEKNSWYKDYLTLNEYTNSVKKPGKRATNEEKAAYEIYQLKKANDNTKKAEQESANLEQYLKDTATAAGRTMTDRQIIEGINWKKYPTLAKMREYAANGAPYALTRSVNGSTDDWAYGVLWAAKNGGGTGNNEADQVNATLGRGNTYAREQNERAKREAEQRAIGRHAGTDNWRELSQDATYLISGQGDPSIAYRNKMEHDTRALKIMKDNPGMTAEQAAIQARNIDLAYGDTIGPNAMREKMNRYAEEEQQNQLDAWHKYNENRDQMIRDRNVLEPDASKLEYNGWLQGWSQDVANEMKIENAIKAVNEQSVLKNKTGVDKGRNYSIYTNEELEMAKRQQEANLFTINSKIDEIRNRQTEWQPEYSGFDSVFDYVADWDENNEKNVLKRNDINDAQRQTAEGQLNELQGSREERKQVALTRAQDFYINNGETVNYQNSPEAKAALRKQAFNDMMGDMDAYDAYAEKLSPDEMKELDNRIDAALGMIDNPVDHPEANADPELSEWESRRRYAENEIRQIENQMAWNEDYDIAMWKAGFDGDTDFHQENEVVSADPIHDAIQVGSGDVSRYDLLYNLNNPSADTIYSFINRGAAYEDWLKVSGNVPDGMKNVALMNDQEIAAFNKYYNAGQKDEAMAFIDGMQQALSQRYSYYEDIKYQALAHQAPIISSLVTIGSTLAQPIEMLATIGGKIFGDKQADNPYSDYYSGTRFKNKVRQYVGDQMSDVGKFFYNAGMSAGDSFINVMAGNAMGLTGNALEYATLGLFGTEAFQTSMQQNLEETKGNWKYSFIESALDALIETATEIWSVENLLSDPSNFIRYIMKTSFSEASEEFVGAAFGPLIEEMLLKKNEWRDRADKIFAEGGYTDNSGKWVAVDNFDDAVRQSLREWNHEIIQSTLSGAVSTGGGIFVGGVRNVSNRLYGQSREAGKAIRNAETGGTSGQDVLLNAALGMNEETKSNKRARKIQEKLDEGKKVSDYELGELAKNIYNETEKQAAKAAQTVVEDKAYEKLEDSGMDDAERREMAQIMSEAVVKGGVDNLSKEQKHKLLTNQAAFNVYKDFMFESETSRETMGAIMDATQETAEVQASVSELLDERRRQATNEAEDPGEQLASEEDIRNAAGTAVEGARGVIVDGQWAKLGNLVEVKEKDAEGNVKTSLRWQISGTDQTVKASQIRATDFSTAAIIRQATVNPGMFSNGFVNTLMKANEQGQIKNVGRFLLDAQKVRMAGYLGMQMPANTMGSQAAQDIYNQAKYEHGKNRDAQLKDGNAGRQGKITFMGAEYGTTEWNQAIKNANLDSNQRAQIDAIAGIAQRAGIEVYFRSAEEVAKEWGTSDPEMTYGWESNTDEHGRGISVNIEGLDFALGENGTPEVRGQHNMLVTFGHEMTHWLQRNSANGYNQLESFVMGEMRRNGVNIQRRVMDVMERRGLSIEDAMSEIVADACDQILANEEVRDHIQETNQGLFKEIKHFVSDLVGRVKAAIKGMDQSASRDAREMMRSANRLAKVWLGAYDEAISGAVREGDAAKEVNERFSMAQLDDDYMQAVKSGDVQQQQSYVDQAAQMAGYTDKAYHGSTRLGFTEFDLDSSGNMIFVSYGKGTASTYTDTGEVRRIGKDYNKVNLNDFSTKDLVNELKNIYGDAVTGTSEEEAVSYVKDQAAKLIKLAAGSEAQNEFANLINNYVNNYGNLSRTDRYRAQNEINFLKNRTDLRLNSKLNDALIDFTTKDIQKLNQTGEAFTIQTNNGTETITRDEAIKRIKESVNPNGMYELYTRPGNQLVIDADGATFRSIYVEELDRFMTTREIANYAKEQGYDSVRINDVIDNGGRNNTGSITDGFGDVGIFFNTNDLKSADPVTYDDKGKVIPLSERFNQENNDIRFSMAQPIEETRDLVAVHNLTARNLLDTLAEGGITAPSIAVVKAKTGHSKFGPISIIFKKSTIDPRSNRKNKLYGTDAWTPTRSNAQIETKLNYEVLQQARDTIMELTKEGTANLWQNDAMNWINQWLYEDQTTDDLDEMVRRAYNNDGMIIAFERAQGREIQEKTELLKEHSDLRHDEIGQYNAFLDKLDEKGILQEFMNDMDSMTGNEIIDKYKNIFGESGEREATILKKLNENPDGLSKRVMFAKMKKARWFQQDGRKIKTYKQFSKAETAEAVRDTLDKKAFDKWVSGLIGGALGKRGVRNSQDTYTAAGRRRSFEALHMEPTAENIVKAMYANHSEKGGEAGGATGLMAKASKEYRNIEEMRADRGRLQQLDDEEYKAKVSALDSKIMDFARKAEETSGWDLYTVRSELIEAGGEYAKAGENAVRRYFRQEKINLTEEQIREAISLMDEAREIETGYFEAKPERVVGLDEIYKVIVPANETEVIDELEKHGIPYETTDGTDEDRLRVLNEQDEARFSKYTHDNMDVEEWMSKAKPWNLVTEDERELLDKYNGLRTRRGLLTKTVLELKADIKRKESILDKLTPDELKDLERAKIKLEEKQQKLLETEDELFRVTSTEGYAGMMYRNNVVLNDWILGKTQDDVREAVEQMVDQVKASERSITAQVKALRKLADSQAVKAVSSMVEKKSLNYAVTSLKKQLNSDMGKTELESRLIEMALKKANGEDIQEDARLLAVDLTNKMRGYEIDTMERLRGITITIGPDKQAEMKGKGMTLQSVRDSLKGTGVKVRYGEYSSLDTDEEDLRTVLPELPQDIGENSADALFKFISWAQSMRDGDLAAKQSMVDIEEETTNVLAIASTIKVNMNSPEYRKQNEAAAKTRQAADELEQAGKTMSEQTELAGRRAIGFTSVLQRDVHQAIEYYNKVAKVAAQEEKNKVRKNLIEELKSENTRKLMEQRDKYEEMMKSDRRNRELAEDNMQIRNRINTIASRINKRLTAETDLKNIPQEAKPLARQVLKMLINHDMVYRHVLFADKKQRQATMQALNAYDMRDGQFNPDRDLNWLIVGEGDNADYDIYGKVCQDLINIEQGLLNYRNAEGQKGVTLMDRREALRKIDDAVSEIWSVIRAREEANFNGKRMLISEMAMQARDDMAKSRFRGEWTGVIGHGIGALRSGVIYGNMTPEYFFKNLKNKTISQLYDEYHRAENRNGLEVGRAQRRIAEIAEKYGYSAWDQEKRYTFKLVKGGTVNLTLGEMMSLYATWQREEANRAEVNGPEESFHLNVGGFYTVQEEKNKILGRELFEQKAHRLTEADMNAIKARMTEEQLDYVRDIVEYITKDIGALGNEASMRMYGIKKYNEQWYFPFEIWEGVKSKKSDQGTTGNTENRTGHQSFTKRRVNNASNALVIRDFTETAVKHIAGMINYNTFAPAIEFMNRVMNTRLDEFGEGEDSNTKRNLRAIIGEIYGKDAVKYLDDFQKDVNGGVTRPDSTIYDKLLSTFKKSAVAGSMSVALQQPLSYIRAAMMVSPKYLATSINLGPRLKSIAEEMRKYSGVAVIKKMGKFDMNFGRSAQDYMMPDAKVSKGRAIYDKASDIATALPELMDTWTWCNMWEAVKKEQATMNPGVDQKSDEFLEKVAERFNDVMRKTQVYDSVLVKSRNMRNTNPIMKSLTSFMSEPTLTANVLYDAVINAKEKGGKTVLAKAATTFVMSAILQAIVKGLISAGRTPQDKKTWDENVAYRVNANLLNELNPMNLLPGYNDLIVLFKEGELSDDATSVVGKLLEAGKTTISVLQGKSENPWYRDLEDTAGVVSQLFTNIPAKNIMRDIRATINYIQAPWANRANSSDVLKYQLLDQIHTADNLTGVLNTWLGDKGWEIKNAAYYDRIYKADKAGKKEKVAGMIEYLTLARNTKKETINEALRGLAKKDKDLSSEEKLKKQQEYGLKDGSSWIRDEYKAGHLDRKTAEKLYREAHPKMTDKQIRESFDKIDEQRKAGK